MGILKRMTFPNVRSDWSDSAWALGDTILTALNISAYCVLADVVQASRNRVALPQAGVWLNQRGAYENNLVRTSRSPMIAFWKMGELLARSTSVGEHEVRCTPVFTASEDRGTGWRGGVQIGKHIIAISGLPQHHDQFIAAVMHMATFSEFDVGLSRVVWMAGIPIVVLKSSEPETVFSTVAEICKGGIVRPHWGKDDGGNVVFKDRQPVLYIDAESSDGRRPARIGLVVE